MGYEHDLHYIVFIPGLMASFYVAFLHVLRIPVLHISLYLNLLMSIL